LEQSILYPANTLQSAQNAKKRLILHIDFVAVTTVA